MGLSAAVKYRSFGTGDGRSSLPIVRPAVYYNLHCCDVAPRIGIGMGLGRYLVDNLWGLSSNQFMYEVVWQFYALTALHIERVAR